MKQIIRYVTLLIFSCLCLACINDRINPEIDYSKPATVKLAIDFSDLHVITPGTKSPGDAIGKMTDVCVLFYEPNGTLATDGGSPIYHYASVNSVESTKIEKKIPAGKYKVVAVANMGNLITNSTYKEKVQNLSDLQSISLQWNNQIASNNQMFGFFDTSAGDNSIDKEIKEKGMSNVSPTTHYAPELSLSGTQTLYAKLYRAVAKVTVAFNGEALNSNVFVTIRSIRLGNLPATCGLWKENSNITNTIAGEGDAAPQSEILTEEDFGLLRVANRGAGTESLFPKAAHSATGPSLFLFENRQGTTPTSGDKDKVKDKKPHGAYIEIEAYYANELSGSNGKITYRYMLGEDVPGSYDNYNLTRNRHYKVTLLLQKSGKEDPYWRVEYEENPTITLPTEVNISYRNSAMLTIPFSVEQDADVAKVEAEIIENPWYDDLIDNKRDAIVKTETPKDKKYGFLAWAGHPSDNAYYGDNKTSAVIVTKTEGKYQLSVQTESLGFKTDKGSELADSFTGYNNYSNPRTAIIRVTVTYHSAKTETAEVKVVQVPRIVNPIAIYREWNSTSKFNIRLLNSLGHEVESYGPWMAEVESGADWIGIKREGTGTYATSFTSGEEGGAIRFDYKPLSSLNSNEETRCGVIVVRFSNYNVEHRIYVRQGYAPTAIGSNNHLWTSYNYIGVDAAGKPLFTNSPMEEGAWLKYGNSIGILANNNTDGFENPPKTFAMSNEKNLTWDEIDYGYAGTFIAPGYNLPQKADIENLTNLREYSGFGIGYDDRATQTVPFDEEAQYVNPTMGKRGFVICDAKGRNLFFPTGKRGYGRRRDISYENNYIPFHGGLHYAHAINEPNFFRPALAGLPKAMGAIYWSANVETLSLNYSLSNIESTSKTSNGLQADACFVRLIKKEDNVKN